MSFPGGFIGASQPRGAAAAGGHLTLVTSGVFNNTNAQFDLNPITARYRFVLVVWFENNTAIDGNFTIRFNADAANNYNYWRTNAGVMAFNAAQALIVAGYAGNGTGNTYKLEFNGIGDDHHVDITSLVDHAGIYKKWHGLIHKGAANVTRITCTSADNCTGRYALYYYTDLE